MFALTDGMHYYLCQHYVDMRKGMTGLYRLVKSDMSLSPVSGDVFVFFSRKRDMVKILRWDTDGFILYQKRLEEGTFEVPRFNPDTGSYELSWKTFLLIMQGVSLRSAKCRKRFRLRWHPNILICISIYYIANTSLISLSSGSFFLSLTHAKGPAHRTSGGSNQIFKRTA